MTGFNAFKINEITHEMERKANYCLILCTKYDYIWCNTEKSA